MTITIKEIDYTPKFGLGFIERAIKEEQPEDNNVLSIALPKLVFHSCAYADERNDLQPRITYNDVIDLIDTIGLHDQIFINFQIDLFKSMRVHMPNDETKKVIDDYVTSLTADDKKKVLKTGVKTGKKM